MRLILAFSALGLSDNDVGSKSSGISSGLQSSHGSHAKSPKWKFFGTKYCKLDKRSKEFKETRINSKAENEIKKYAVENSREEVRANLEQNFHRTPFLMKEGLDKAYVDDAIGETTCPYQIRESIQNKIRRIPNAIGIGMAKCGTGTLSFLDCHPNIVFRGTEPRYFIQEQTNRRIIRAWRTRDAHLLHVLRHMYTNNLPRAAWDEILIEKSPQYLGGKKGEALLRAMGMKILNPKLKLIVVLCDPIKQQYSQLRMQERRANDYTKKGKNIEDCGACLKTDFKTAFWKWAQNMKGRKAGSSFWDRLMNPWRKVFKDESIHYVDGENLVKNPQFEMDRLLEFLEAPEQTFRFEYDQAKAFGCLQKPLPFCLNPAKGNSRKTDVYTEFPRIAKEALNNIKSNIGSSISILGINTKKEKEAVCACERENFQWLDQFICPLVPETVAPPSYSYSDISDETSSTLAEFAMGKSSNRIPNAAKTELMDKIDEGSSQEVKFESSQLRIGQYKLKPDEHFVEQEMPFKDDNFYDLSENHGMGPQSFRSDWDADYGAALYQSFVQARLKPEYRNQGRSWSQIIVPIVCLLLVGCILMPGKGRRVFLAIISKTKCAEWFQTLDHKTKNVKSWIGKRTYRNQIKI